MSAVGVKMRAVACVPWIYYPYYGVVVLKLVGLKNPLQS